MAQLITLIVLITVGYVTGSIIERNHYASIEEREKQKAHLPVLTTGKNVVKEPVMGSKLVTGSAVISIDYFKRFLAQLITLLVVKLFHTNHW